MVRVSLPVAIMFEIFLISAFVFTLGESNYTAPLLVTIIINGIIIAVQIVKIFSNINEIKEHNQNLIDSISQEEIENYAKNLKNEFSELILKGRAKEENRFEYLAETCEEYEKRKIMEENIYLEITCPYCNNKTRVFKENIKCNQVKCHCCGKTFQIVE